MKKKNVISTLLCLLAGLVIYSIPLMAQENTEEEQSFDTLAVIEIDGEGIDSVAVAAQVEETPSPPTLWDYFASGKYLAFVIVAIAGLVLLLGNWVNKWVRLAMITIALILFGLDYFYPLHPSPMCATTKLFMFKFTRGQFYTGFIAMLLAIVVPSFIGRKLFCGWVCPLGALQELINKIPHKFKWKQFNFTAFNSMRMTLFVFFFLSFFAVRDQIIALGQAVELNPYFGAWPEHSAFNIYDKVNFFELLHWNIDTTFVIMMSILVISSLVLYRPFCYLICPIGALTWLIEKISLGRIRVNHEECTECGICTEESPCPTIKPMHEDNAMVLPDCTSCGECVKSCPENAIKFSFFR